MFEFPTLLLLHSGLFVSTTVFFSHFRKTAPIKNFKMSLIGNFRAAATRAVSARGAVHMFSTECVAAQRLKDVLAEYKKEK